jgi:predicted nuclease of restriction endonuclease-like RecB superfamily
MRCQEDESRREEDCIIRHRNFDAMIERAFIHSRHRNHLSWKAATKRQIMQHFDAKLFPETMVEHGSRQNGAQLTPIKHKCHV